MVYTVTFNPSLDYVVSLQGFEMGMTNRTKEEHIFAGGKGINVSFVLHNLAVDTTALGFVSGFTGREIESIVKEYGISYDFIQTSSGFSRINVKLKDYDGTEINGMGPVVEAEDMKKLMEKLAVLQKDDVLVLAGSVSKGLSETVYGEIMEALQEKGILVVVDAVGALLKNTLRYRPFLIKPNHHELGELFHTKLHTKEEVLTYARKLQKKGARNVLVSMSKEGAVLVTENGKAYGTAAPKGRLINAVGAGDSMVAGFIAGWTEKKEYLHAFSMGVAAGSASAFSEYLATGEEIVKIYKQLERIEEYESI